MENLCFYTVILLVTRIFFFPSVVGAGGLLGLPSTNQIRSLAVAYQDTLSLQFGVQRVFPVLEFPFHGRIIGWTFAAVEMAGQRPQRPFLTTWTEVNSATLRYSLNEPVSTLAERLDNCVTSTVTLRNEMEVAIHDSGPMAPGLNFSTGDRLGLFLQTQNNADFIPYLYSGLLQSEVNASVDGNFSASQVAGSIRRGRAIGARRRDQLLPLIALKLCSFEDVGIEGVSICNGTTFQRSAEVCSSLRTATTSAPPAETTEDATTKATTAEDTTTFTTIGNTATMTPTATIEDATTTEDTTTFTTTGNTATMTPTATIEDAKTEVTAEDITTMTPATAIEDATTTTVETTEGSSTKTTTAEDTTTEDATTMTTTTTTTTTTPEGATTTTEDTITTTAATTDDTTTITPTTKETTSEDTTTMTATTITEDTTTVKTENARATTMTEAAAEDTKTRTEDATTASATEDATMAAAATTVADDATMATAPSGAATTQDIVSAETSGGKLMSQSLLIMLVPIALLHCLLL